jgi:hypothetical protein
VAKRTIKRSAKTGRVTPQKARSAVKEVSGRRAGSGQYRRNPERRSNG